MEAAGGRRRRGREGARRRLLPRAGRPGARPPGHADAAVVRRLKRARESHDRRSCAEGRGGHAADCGTSMFEVAQRRRLSSAPAPTACACACTRGRAPFRPAAETVPSRLVGLMVACAQPSARGARSARAAARTRRPGPQDKRKEGASGGAPSASCRSLSLALTAPLAPAAPSRTPAAPRAMASPATRRAAAAARAAPSLSQDAAPAAVAPCSSVLPPSLRSRLLLPSSPAPASAPAVGVSRIGLCGLAVMGQARWWLQPRTASRSRLPAAAAAVPPRPATRPRLQRGRARAAGLSLGAARYCRRSLPPSRRSDAPHPSAAPRTSR